MVFTDYPYHRREPNHMEFENQLEIGNGIYTPSEIAKILRVPYAKVFRWITKYWDGELGKEFAERYSWKVENSMAVSFHTLVEFHSLMQFAEAGVKTRQVLEAHKDLSGTYDTAFPFAMKEVLDNIKTDGFKIYLSKNRDVVTLDGTRQLNLDFIRFFFRKLDFDSGNIATRFWPLGKEKSILIDPKRKFGHPVIDDRNIYPETIHGHYIAGDPIAYISHVYNLSEKQIQYALEFCEAA